MDRVSRRSYLGGTEIGYLMRGEKQEINRVWREKIGEQEPEDLSFVWPVQRGLQMQPLIARWYRMKIGGGVSREDEFVRHPIHRWAGCHLDAWDDLLGCPIEIKDVGGHEPFEILLERYQPQLQWQMLITGAKQAAFSVSMAAREPIIEYIDHDPEYAAECLVRGRQFWDHVESRTPPVVLDPVPSPEMANRIVDMTGNNYWATQATIWLETKPFAEQNEEAAKLLKNLTEKDARKSWGHGVVITRDRAGRQSIRRDK